MADFQEQFISSLTQLFPIHQYDQGCLLGKGSYGEVFQYNSKLLDGHPIAVKLPKDSVTSDIIRKMSEEINVMQLLQSHTNIVHYFGTCLIDGQVGIVMELCDLDLKKFLESGPKLTPSQAIDLLNQITDGIGFLHGKGVIHRDLKPENILLKATGGNDFSDESGMCPKLSDFGFCKIIDKHSATMSVKGTLSYMAPELIAAIRKKGGGEKLNLHFNKKADVYSLGKIAEDLIQRLNDNEQNNCNMALLKLFTKKAMAENPQSRPTSQELLMLLQTYLKDVSIRKEILEILTKHKYDQLGLEVVSLTVCNALYVLGTSKGQVRFFDLEQLCEKPSNISHKGQVLNLVSCDKYLACSSDDETVSLWDLTNLNCVSQYPHSNAILGLAINTRFVVSIDRNLTVRIFDLKKLAPHGSLKLEFLNKTPIEIEERIMATPILTASNNLKLSGNHIKIPLDSRNMPKIWRIVTSTLTEDISQDLLNIAKNRDYKISEPENSNWSPGRNSCVHILDPEATDFCPLEHGVAKFSTLNASAPEFKANSLFKDKTTSLYHNNFKSEEFIVVNKLKQPLNVNAPEFIYYKSCNDGVIHQ